jgi:hypothetical protein
MFRAIAPARIENLEPSVDLGKGNRRDDRAEPCEVDLLA